MVGKEKAVAKLPGKAGAESREAPAPQLTLFSTSVAHLPSPDPEALFFWKQVPGGKGNKTAGPSPTAPSTRGPGMADRERVGARFGGSEMSYTLGHTALPEAGRRFLSRGSSYPDTSKTFGKPF